MSGPENNPLAAIFGCSGPKLSKDERRFFRDAGPLGFILFERNCQDPEQVRRLVDDLRGSVGREDAPVLIDQEGGRVARLKPPHWRDAPAASRFCDIVKKSKKKAVEAARLNARLIAAELNDIGINVNCAPVLDIPQRGADPIIGDRAAGNTPKRAALLGRAVCDGLMDGGVLPVIKHIPGHGRADVDSHKALPVVEPMPVDLRNIDFAPFLALSDMPWAMTAHVIYRAIDALLPATTSTSVIEGIIRGYIGFRGFLISDDLSMRALYGDLTARTDMSLKAGCDAVLHCNGNMDEMKKVAAACSPLKFESSQRFERAEAARRGPESFDVDAAKARLDELLESA